MSDNLNLYQKIVERVLGGDSDFELALTNDPKGTLEKEGFVFPDEVTDVKIVQDSQSTIHFVMPIPRGEGDNIFC